MKKLFILIIPLLVIFAAVGLFSGNDSELCHITYQEFEKINLKKAKIVDVRTTAEYQSGHLKNAVNIDVLKPDFKDEIEKLDKGTKYYVYCKTGKRSAKAVEIMVGDGFSDVCNIEGGILNMQKNGVKLVK